MKVGKEIQTKEVASSGSSANDAPGSSTGTAAAGEAGLLRLFLIMGLLN